MTNTTNTGITQTITLGNGSIITIETGRLAKLADGAVVVKCGDTMVLATVVSSKEAKEGVDFLPLTVDYKEKYSAVGKFPGGFFKREARPSDYEILIDRIIDRALRPLFPDDYHAETQVAIMLISAEKNVAPDALVCLAASAAIAVSDIPFNGPVSEVRIGRINGQFVINPTISDLEISDIDLMVAGTLSDIMMVEGEMKEVSEDDMIEAIKLAHEQIKIQCNAQTELGAKVEKSLIKRTYSHETDDFQIRDTLKAAVYQKLYDVAKKGNPVKAERKAAFEAVKDEYIATLSEEEAKEKGQFIKKYFYKIEKEAVRRSMLDEQIRLDGRKMDQIRPIWSEVDYLPSVHGSSIFTRGETQSLTTVTLGTKLDEQIIDGAIFKGTEKFILHYNFPSFSTGEARPNRGTSRREVGHGNLALRALKNMIPKGEENPYTIRIVSDILESNGSSSMATVCAGTLALLDAGIKMKKSVSGIAMGLVTDEAGKYVVLSDILGDEDHLGDMDFKVTGTVDGITACQMDIKVDGLRYEVLAEALQQAKAGRLHILKEMEKTLSVPRAVFKPFVPRIVQLSIPKEFIGAIIGPGGKVIQEMQKMTNTVISIEEKGEFGIVQISSENVEGIEAAVAKVKAITTVPEVGEVYTGKVKSIMPFGAFVEILPGKDGLLHISEIDWSRLETVESVLKEGDVIQVKLIEIDKKTGKMKLSRKVLLPKPEKQEQSNQ
ncbi:MAG: polyribonucleotide nucleotidyltransferase [Bacteroidetes bacterium]|nr:polyribonucleotide nucleotidyltransferase [Bacteroidota bacterium]HET6243117.1 polyribonucleotide nucleotidyltransferase [Bacteroidia bacterium]